MLALHLETVSTQRTIKSLRQKKSSEIAADTDGSLRIMISTPKSFVDLYLFGAITLMVLQLHFYLTPLDTANPSRRLRLMIYCVYDKCIAH